MAYKPTFDIFEAVASEYGSTGLADYESGMWKDHLKGLEKQLGKKKYWHILEDEEGNVRMIIGRKGVFKDYASNGALDLYQGSPYGWQLPTDMSYDVATKTAKVEWGNIPNDPIDPGKGVKKKGLAATATKGSKVLGGAIAALGGIMTGVQWYKDNPQFWTDLSSKLLPFCYKDPTDKSWGDIFQEALVPTAVDGDGTSYVQADLINAVAQSLLDGGFYDVRTDRVLDSDIIDSAIEAMPQGKPVLNRVLNPTARGDVTWYGNPDAQGYRYPSGAHAKSQSSTTYGTTFHNLYDDYYSYGIASAEAFNREFDPQGISNNISTTEYVDGYPVASSFSGTTKKFSEVAPYATPDAVKPYPISNIYVDTDRLNDLSSPTGEKWTLTGILGMILVYGSDKITTPVDNTSLYPDATYPQPGQSLADVYPEWFNDAVTTVNPDYDPTKPEGDDNPKYVTWLPVQFPDDVTEDGGSTDPDTTPEDKRKGKPTPQGKEDIADQTNDAVDDGVLPDPYPEPDTEPSTGSATETPTPPTPGDPDPSDPQSPVVGGGSANALWRIYNPSLSILQSFGAWLWSADPVKLIREIFSNNPAEGIVGLHMIYVTPPVGGTDNIKVGYLDSGIASPWVSQQYVSIDCGSVGVPLRYNNALDFGGYTRVYVYLPFIGIQPLDAYDIVGKTVSIKYTVDVLTGTVLAQISVANTGGYNAVLYTFNGSCAVEYPLTSGSRASQLQSLITGAVGGAVMGGAGGALFGAARGAAGGADVRMSGNLSGNAGAMGIRKPYIIVKRPVEAAPLNYNSYYGYPASKTVYLRDCTGYTRVKSAHVQDIRRASDTEKDQIAAALKDGVVIR